MWPPRGTDRLKHRLRRGSTLRRYRGSEWSCGRRLPSRGLVARRAGDTYWRKLRPPVGRDQPEKDRDRRRPHSLDETPPTWRASPTRERPGPAPGRNLWTKLRPPGGRHQPEKDRDRRRAALTGRNSAHLEGETNQRTTGTGAGPHSLDETRPTCRAGPTRKRGRADGAGEHRGEGCLRRAAMPSGPGRLAPNSSRGGDDRKHQPARMTSIVEHLLVGRAQVGVGVHSDRPARIGIRLPLRETAG